MPVPKPPSPAAFGGTLSHFVGEGLIGLLAAVLLFIAVPARAAATDDIADALISAANQAITVDTVQADFKRLTLFVRHDAPGMVLFTDGGATDGYVRHAQAHFQTGPAKTQPDQANPLFVVAFEFVDQSDFTFSGLAAALEQRLGSPARSSNQAGAIFRSWSIKQKTGRSLTVAHAEGSDNGDQVTIVQLTQER